MADADPAPTRSWWRCPRRPTPSAWPRDLAGLPPRGGRRVFPAWETLPFERVSPSIETMGRRLRVLWRLRTGDPTLRWWWPRPGPSCSAWAPTWRTWSPSWCAAGDRVDLARAGGAPGAGRLPPRVPGGAPGRGRGARVHRRRVPRHRRRPGAHRPLGRRGRPAGRVLRGRPAHHRRGGRGRAVPGPRAAAHRRGPGAGRAPRAPPTPGAASSGSAWPTARCSRAWRPGCPGSSAATRHRRARAVRPAARPTPRSCWSSPGGSGTGPWTCWPRRSTWAPRLARTWGLDDDHDLPRLHVDFERLLAHTDAPSWSVASVADSPDSPGGLGAGRGRPRWAAPRPLLGQLRQVVADGYRVVVCADGAGSAARIDKLLTEHGLSFPVLAAGGRLAPTPRRLRAPGGAIVVAPLERGCILPEVKLALLAEADLTGRRRTHRPARAPKRDAQRFFEDLKVGDYVVHQHHGVGPLRRHGHAGPWAAPNATTCCSSTRATTSSTSRRTRSTRSGSTPAARPRRSTAWAAPTSPGPRPRCARRWPRSPRSWWCCTRPACNAAGHAFAPDTPWQQRDGGGLPLPGDPRPAARPSRR